MKKAFFDIDGIQPTRLAILSSLARRPSLGATEIKKRLELLGWRRQEGSHLPILQKLLTDGLVAGTEGGDARLYTLTAAGWEKLQDWLDSADAINSLFGDLLHAPTPRLAAPTHANKEAMTQRLPTAEEMERIIGLCKPHVARILRAHQITGRSPAHLAEIKIDAIDWKESVARLPAFTREKRPIKNRTVQISPELVPVLIEAIDGRESGWVFVTRSSQRWIRDRISRAFRQARKAAGLPEEVLIMGRGGSLNAAGEQGDDGDD